MTVASQKEQVREIKLKLLLSGGHEYTVFLKSDSPLLQLLIKVLLSRSQNKTDASSLLQIPIEEGRSCLSFSSDDLIGMVSTPPIYLQDRERETQSDPVIQLPTVSASSRDDLISRYALINNFFTPTENQQLFDYVCQKQADFVPTTTSTNADNYRRSLVLHSFPEFRELIVNKIVKIIPDILSKLNMEPFAIGEIESQLTLHNDGNFYKVHNDNGSPDTATRTLTYVYYFNREPKAFSGGELVIYDSKIQGKYYVKADTFKTIEPRNNVIVFFHSRYMHEVLPVKCVSKEFADSRFTINGWVRRAE
ncbi:MAG: proline hydroxylase [Okeania sp. SIO2H7]|nr:proline hydroxylase [Okeania sp. SIO2H7]